MVFLLFLLPVSSYLCNHYISYPVYQRCDHTIIILLCLTYYFHHHSYYLPICLVSFYVIELFIAHQLNVTFMIAFVALNLFALTHFTTLELILGIIVFCIAIITKMNRKNHCSNTYPYYTIVWYLCCVILLLLATRSIKTI